MKLFKIQKVEDFGTAYEFSLLQRKTRTFLQLSIGWYDYPSWPYLQVSFGLNNLMDILFSLHSFGLNFTIFSHNWDGDR